MKIKKLPEFPRKIEGRKRKINKIIIEILKIDNAERNISKKNIIFFKNIKKEIKKESIDL